MRKDFTLPNTGLPPNYKERSTMTKNKVLSIRINEHLKELYTQKAEQDHENVSNLTIRLIKEYLVWKNSFQPSTPVAPVK